jgi:hypothetical protein
VTSSKFEPGVENQIRANKRYFVPARQKGPAVGVVKM